MHLSTHPHHGASKSSLCDFNGTARIVAAEDSRRAASQRALALFVPGALHHGDCGFAPSLATSFVAISSG